MFECVCEAGIPYAESAGRDLKLDLYRPALPDGSPPPPIIVYMHGGGWIGGIRSGPSSVAFGLELAGEGFAFASIDYRLALDHPAPAAIEDCRLAVRFLRSKAESLGVDGSRIVAMGNSAGGHLAAMLGLLRPGDGLDGEGLKDVDSSVLAVVDLCGITDIPALLDDAARAPWAAAWIQQSGEARRQLAERCSPLTWASRKAPPFLIVHGENDSSVPFGQAARFAEALQGAGNICNFIPIPEAGHQLGVTAGIGVQRKLRKARRDFFRNLGLPG